MLAESLRAISDDGGRRIYSTDLLDVQLDLLKDESYKKVYISLYKPAFMACSGHLRGGKGVYHGDSGGSLMSKQVRNGKIANVLVGVTSFGDGGCAREGVPGVFTKVSSYIDWMQQVMG